jgi:N-acylglucosamine-6-phosphate 2-epimerase
VNSLADIQNGLIVSCHMDPAMKIDAAVYLEGITQAAEQGGAAALRVEGVANVRNLRKKTSLPIIGLVLAKYDDGSDLITATLADIKQLTDAGADIVAVDGTNRQRPSGANGFSFLHEAVKHSEVPVWSDISTFEEGVRSAEIGADLVATTLSGYTRDSAQSNACEPDYELVSGLSSSLVIPVIAEGRVYSPEDAAQAISVGAYAVVVGTAITRPSLITKMFVSAMQPRKRGNF